MQFEPIFKTYDEINAVAESFLASYSPDFSIFVDIEEILDNKLKIDIIPLPDLKNSFSRAGLDIDAFIANDFSSISVDEFIYHQRPNRLRFSLAHEIGHMFLHSYMYQEFTFESRDEWKKLIQDMSVEKRDMLERQADNFAGLVLVPRKVFKKEFYKAIKEAEDICEFKYDDNSDGIKKVIFRFLLPDKFKVSENVIRIRASKDKII
ncbi:MAG: ImmA/IrrE family metallo-endopeptidase [Candidatus Omnitrophica bacterium]|nr:ImmA/IrrE family metallo-endopeptidase [Candidatus Omnitrophota bacterium]